MTDISIPKEVRPHEYRVALAPSGVHALTRAGHRVFVEHDAGLGSGFDDEAYRQVGATIVYSHEEAWVRGQMVLKVARPTNEEFALLSENQIVLGFMHLAAGRREKIHILKENGACVIGWETVQQEDGFLPVLRGISTIAGRMMPQIVGRFMQNDHGGRGVALSGCPTVPPAEIVILGAGTFGSEAAMALAGVHASVYVLDIDNRKLERLNQRLAGRGVTMAATDYNLRKVVRFADAIIGAVYVPGERAPILLTRELLRTMRPRSLFVDASIDQGGCAETSRPTTHGNPTYVEEGIIHYCVPNITSVVGRTTTHSLTHATLPYLLAIANEGLEKATRRYPELARGINICRGEIIHEGLKHALGEEVSS
ncbi:MAG TPA: alanine dehydrogenase [Anaerolineae bacterium]|nr:alanine dehydrogenase [Anaerolineae bacterium]